MKLNQIKNGKFVFEMDYHETRALADTIHGVYKFLPRPVSVRRVENTLKFALRADKKYNGSFEKRG